MGLWQTSMEAELSLQQVRVAIEGLGRCIAQGIDAPATAVVIPVVVLNGAPLLQWQTAAHVMARDSSCRSRTNRKWAGGSPGL